jgi:hypothetical protein
MKMSVHSVAAVAAVSLGLVAVSATGAGAAPINAPSHGSGTFTCSDGSSGTYVNNQGTNHDPKQAWIPGFPTFSDGSTAVFVPTSIVVTIDGTVVFAENKGNTSGPLTCVLPITGGTIVVTGTLVAS